MNSKTIIANEFVSNFQIFVFVLIAAAYAAEKPPKRVQRDIIAGVYPGVLPAGVIPAPLAYPYGFGARYLE